MSQVIVTDDRLKAKRAKSRDQEHQIQREAQFARWRRSDVTKLDPAAVLVGILTTVLVALISIPAWLLLELPVQLIFRPLGKLLGGKTSLITGGDVGDRPKH